MEYKIVNSDLGYKILRKNGNDIEFYDVKGGWNKSKTFAKLYFHREDAMSALVVIKRKNEKKSD